jgi:hypothetical protein
LNEGSRKPSPAKSHTSLCSASQKAARFGANVVRIPIFVDGVWCGNEFVRIGPGLRASIRRLAMEGRR